MDNVLCMCDNDNSGDNNNKDCSDLGSSCSDGDGKVRMKAMVPTVTAMVTAAMVARETAVTAVGMADLHL
jgi:hypothetical protein